MQNQNYLKDTIFVDSSKKVKKNRYNYKFEMSSTSIQFKDEGYTSPDFLTNLFKKPLYSNYNISSFQTNSTEFKDHILQPSSKENLCPTSFNSPFHDDTKESPLKIINISNSPKFYHSHTFIDDDAISKKKYKIFFKTIMNGHMNEEQISSVWENLERVMKDPFAFDLFLNQVREKREKEDLEQKKTNCEEQLKIDYTKRTYGKSVDNKQRSQVASTRILSNEKAPKLNQSLLDKQTKNRASIRQSIVSMKNIITKGEKLIRQK